ncbi:MAG: pca operon transcription factor PcaQ [Rhodospirillales bacterium]|nr:pca operon transcription factor PcaQ [Rhodospirillales bacterium]
MLDRRIKFRHLQCFLEVARNQSVMRAADSLAITQPAVSKTIRELEETLDVRLFDRSKKGVTLTNFGEIFLRYAGASLTALQQGVDSMAQARMKGEAQISVGVLPTVAARIIPNAVEIFKSGGVETIVSLTTGGNGVLLGQLRVGELDLVVGRLAEPDLMTGLSFTHLYSEHVVFIVRNGHPLTRLPQFDISRIVEYTVLLPDKASIIRPSVDRFLIAHGIGTIQDRVETVSMAFGRAYTRQTDAVWIISNGVAAMDVEEGNLVKLAIDTSDTQGPVGLTTRTDTAVSPALQMFINAVQEAARQITQ